MADKPTAASGYSLGQLELVRATCLYVATKLGDLLDDIVVVGGLVPSLIVDQTGPAADTERHPGTQDLDLGLALRLLDQSRYRALSERLRAAGFSPDQSAQRNPIRQRWKVESAGSVVTVEFLIPPSRSNDRGGMLRDLEQDFAAVIVPGLQLAFADRLKIALSGTTIFGENAAREMWVCGPAAFVILKALAFEGRGSNKDAYDLYYVVRNFGNRVDDIALRLHPLRRVAEAKRALEILRRDFREHNGLGPVRVAQFLRGTTDDDIQADVVGFVTRFVQVCEAQSLRGRRAKRK